MNLPGNFGLLWWWFNNRAVDISLRDLGLNPLLFEKKCLHQFLVYKTDLRQLKIKYFADQEKKKTNFAQLTLQRN